MKRLIDHYRNRFVSRWVVLLMDSTLVIFAFMMSTVIRFNFELNYIDTGLFKYHLLLVLAIKLIFFLVFRTYSGIIRHSSMVDTRNILNALFGATITLLVIGWVGGHGDNFWHIPGSILAIDLCVSAIGLIGTRIVIKDLFHGLSRNWKKRKYAVIYGAGNLGIATKNALNTDLDSAYKVLFFIDDDPQKRGLRIEGVKVYDREDAKKLIQRSEHKNLELIFAIHTITTVQKNEISEEFMDLGISLRVVPPVEKWINGQLSSSQIADISIEDLLERAPIQINNDNVKDYLYGKRILVTGAAGSIGSEIVRQVLAFQPEKLILVDQAESPLYDLESELTRMHACPEDKECLAIAVESVTNQTQMQRLFTRFKPHVVFHAAAYKHVPMMEDNPLKALEVNVLGTRVVADLAVMHKTERFVFISTDKAVNPTNVMGASKRLAEIYVQSLNTNPRVKTRFITTRFGNVLGSNGSVIPLFKKQIAEGGPVTVTHPEIYRYFMTIPEACQLVLEAGTMGKGGEILVFDMGVPVKILDLAHKMIRLSGKEPNKQIEIKFTGLRPGEKLFEELLSDGESTLPTHHPKIMVARMREVLPYEEVKYEMEAVSMALPTLKAEEAVQFLKRMIPEYISQNSKYEELDKVEHGR